MNTLEYALALKYPVFPVGPDKVPLIKNWEAEASTDPAKIKQWYAHFGKCNFGIPMGRAGLLGLDLDNKPDKDGRTGIDNLKSYMQEKSVTMPRTFTVKTPSGGFHFYFKTGDRKLGSRNGVLPRVDIKSSGGYLVLPGGVSAVGSYTIVADSECAPVPEWIADLLTCTSDTRREDALKPDENGRVNGVVPDTQDALERAASIAKGWDPAVEGERNAQLFQMARELCKCGVSIDVAEQIYEEHGTHAIWWDEDDPDRKTIRPTIESAYAFDGLHDFGIYLRDFPPLPEEPEKDAFDMALRSTSSGSDSIEADSDPEDEPFDATEMLEWEEPHINWLCFPWLPDIAGVCGLFSAGGGTGKSLMARDFAIYGALGEPIYGYQVRRRFKVLYVTCEEDRNQLNFRFRKNPDFKRVPKGMIKLWSRLGKANTLCTQHPSGLLKPTEWYFRLVKIAKAFFGKEGGYLILDTAADVFCGNEIDRGAVNSFVKHYLVRIGLEAGCGILLLGHPAKGEAKLDKGYSGSTAWDGAFRFRMEATPLKASENPNGRPGPFRWRNAKNNFTSKGENCVLINEDGVIKRYDEFGAMLHLEKGILDAIREAEEEGNPFGLTPGSNRPIKDAVIIDPFTDGVFPSKEVLEQTKRMVADGKLLIKKHMGKKVLGVPLPEVEETKDNSLENNEMSGAVPEECETPPEKQQTVENPPKVLHKRTMRRKKQ